MSERKLEDWIDPKDLETMGPDLPGFLYTNLHRYALTHHLTVYHSHGQIPPNPRTVELLQGFAVPKRGGFCWAHSHDMALFVWGIGAYAEARLSYEPQHNRVLVTWICLDKAFYDEVGQKLQALQSELEAEVQRLIQAAAKTAEKGAPPPEPRPDAPPPPASWVRLNSPGL